MVYSDFFGSPRNTFDQRSLPPPPHDDRRVVEPTRVLKKQNPVRASAADISIRPVSTPHLSSTIEDDSNQLNQDEIFERSRERREQRKLKRVAVLVKTQVTTFVSSIDPKDDPRCLSMFRILLESTRLGTLLL